jgi:hypothetical protein
MSESLWSSPFSRGITPVHLDLNFEDENDKYYPWRVSLPDQYFLCPAIGIYPAFVFPIPQGYRTDGPSIPWFAQWVVKKDGPAWPAALPHDLGCSAELFDVDTVNKIMGAAMDYSPIIVPEKRRIQWAVDNFCWMTWKKHKKSDVESDRELILEASKSLWNKFEPLFEGYARIEEISPAF